MTMQLKVDLDKAAYFCLYGATLVAVTGEAYNATLTMEVPSTMWKAIKDQPLVNYVEYMKKRKRLKAKIKKANGFLTHINKQNYHKSFAKRV